MLFYKMEFIGCIFRNSKLQLNIYIIYIYQFNEIEFKTLV